jgi:hypothetical protein
MTAMHIYQNPNAQKALGLLRKGMNMKPSSLRNTLLAAMLTFVMSAAFGQDHMAGVPGSLLWQGRFAGERTRLTPGAPKTPTQDATGEQIGGIEP